MSYKSINKTLKYSIRKLAIGATPVVIGTFLLAGGTTALASEGSGSNVSINYVADSELTDYEKSLVKQGIPEELKNGETYYLVYKNEEYLQKNKLPDTGSTSLPLKGIGFATALLTVVLVSKKNRNKILGIVLIGALGQSVVLPGSTFALENNLLAGYNHIVSVNSKFEDNLISIDGYKYIGYVTSQDLEVKLENKKNSNQGNVTKSNSFEKINDERIEQGIEENTKEQTQKRLDNKKSDNTSNDNIIEINRENENNLKDKIEKEKSERLNGVKKDNTSNSDIKKINEEKENNLIDKSEKEKSEKLNNVKKDDSSNKIIKKENSLNDKTENEKTKVEKNLTDIVENDSNNIPLPIIAEEVLSETIRYDELEIDEIGNIDVANENKINTTKADYLVNAKDNNELSMNSATELKTSESNKVEKTTTESKVKSTLEDKRNANNENNIKKSADIENINNSKSTIEDNKTNNPSDKINRTVNSLNKNSNSENSNITNKRTKTKSKVKVVERVIKVTETIPYKVVYEEDENMENGITKVIKEGTVGEKVSIQKVVINNDEELKREITSSTVKQKEVDKVIKVGTKGVKKHNSEPEINNNPQSDTKTKLIPKKETVYTEIVESKQRKYVKDYPKLEEATKDKKNNIGLLTAQKDKLSTINITNIFDDSLFEGERRFENIMMYYVQANLKRKREYENQEEVIDNIISKEIPVITGVMRIGTRKPGFETLKGDGKLVNISSNLDGKEIKNIKLSNNNSFILDKDVPGYLGSAINVNYEKDFKNTKLGLKFDANKIQAQSIPTIYHYNKKTQLFKPLKTQIIGNMAYANINESGAYIVVDKYEQDRLRKSNKDLIPGDTGDSDTVNKLNKQDEIKKSGNSIVSKGKNNSDTVNKLNKQDEIKKSDNSVVSKGIKNSDTVEKLNKQDEIKKADNSIVSKDINNSDTVNKLNKKDEIKQADNSIVPKDIIDSKVKNISENGTGRSIVFVIDNSGFVGLGDPHYLRRSLPKRIMTQLDPLKDKVSIVDFGNNIKINKPLTNNFEAISKTLDTMDVDLGMGDDLTDGLSSGIDRLIEDKDKRNKRYIFLLTTKSGLIEGYRKMGKKANDNNVTIFAINLYSGDDDLLKQVSNETGGKFYKVNKIDDLPEIFNKSDEDLMQGKSDINKDRISAYYTRKILKGKLYLSTGKESPYFKKQIKIAREKISKEFNIGINDITAINKKIDDLNDDYIESLLSADYDNDNLVNGNEVRPEKDLRGWAFLYVLSDPENPDTDGDGIRDDKDGSIDLKLESNTDIEPDKITKFDTDGDGYDDADEQVIFKSRGMKDDFGREFSSGDWNVGFRDLLMFSKLAYFDFENEKDSINKKFSRGKRLSEISLKEWKNNVYGKVNEEGKYFGSEEFHDLKFYRDDSLDRAFFTNWRFLGQSKLEYYELKHFGGVTSSVSYFKNGSNLVIAFRGTDEELEKATDSILLLGTRTAVQGIARKQIRDILDNVFSKGNIYKFQEIENVYITGHSLGGYQAYYAFLEMNELMKIYKNKPDSKYRFVKNVSVVNFNGPGIKYAYNELEKLYDANPNSVRAFRTIGRTVISNSLNAAIVGLGKHPNIESYDTAVLKNNYYKTDFDHPVYVHSLNSFYAHMVQGYRNTIDKYYYLPPIWINSNDKIRKSGLFDGSVNNTL